MLRISQRHPGTHARGGPRVDARLELPFELRCRSRFRARLENGEEVGVVLARGQILRGGDLLLADDGRVVEVRAAPESVSTVHASDARQLARVAYHLGNRHVALQIGDGWLRYSHDHVLDEMAQGLGAQLTVEQAPFEPEAGAYHAHKDAAQSHGEAGHSHGEAGHSHPGTGHSHEH